jgi:hypothetical protein
MIALAERKLEFIREVSSIEDERMLTELVAAYRQIAGEAKTNKQVKSIRQKFDANAIRLSRGHSGHDKAKIMSLIREMNVQEPIEELLAQLTK